MYSVGIILFELYSLISTAMERSRLITELRKLQRLPEEFTSNYPKISSVIQSCLDLVTSRRLSASQLLSELSEPLNHNDVCQNNQENLKYNKIIKSQQSTIKQKNIIIERQSREIERLKKIIKELENQINK